MGEDELVQVLINYTSRFTFILYNNLVSLVNMYPPLNDVFAQDLLINLGFGAS